jgi:Fe-S cluster assembly scaffold protein SufB
MDYKKIHSVGFNETVKIGSLFVENARPLCLPSAQKGVLISNIHSALKDKNVFGQYFNKLVPSEKDEYTKAVSKNLHSGYFIRAGKGVKTKDIIQTCLYIGKNKFAQKVHNLIIAEENSELNILTGCLTDSSVKEASHIGITEIFVGKNAKVNFTMVHNWGEKVLVRPRTAIKVEIGGAFVSNYICLNPVFDLQMFPVCYLAGKNSAASFNSFIYAASGSKLDLGAKAVLNGVNSRAEVLSKIVCDKSTVINRGYLVGNVKGIKAHLACEGLIISKKGKISAIPELEANLADLEMTHEAAIGKISAEAIDYLQCRGFSEKQAISMIIKGFLDVSTVNLPQVIGTQLKNFKFE